MERPLGYVAAMVLDHETKDGVVNINPDPEAARWVVQFRWRDDQGRFCTRYVCEAWGAAGGESAQTVAERIAVALTQKDPPT